MHGLNLYDYSARYYDSAIGRFTTIDPLAEKYYSWSPYAYCYNNPLKFVDPDGRTSRRMLEGQLWLLQQEMNMKGKEDPDDIIIDYEAKAVEYFRTEDNVETDKIYRREKGKITENLGEIPTGTFNYQHFKDNGYNLREIKAAGFMITDLGLSLFGCEVLFIKAFGWIGKAIYGSRASNAAKNTVMATETLSKTSSGFKKILTPIDEFDAAVIVYRGTTGSEATSSILFITDNAVVAASYAKSGGQVVSYRISQFGKV